MKRFIYIMAVFAALAVSCQKVDNLMENQENDAAYIFDFDVSGDGFLGTTKADATVGWTLGEKVFVFFKPEGGSLITNGYLTLTRSSSGWSQSSSLTSGSLGTSGKMVAVYVPYLGEKTPAYSGDKWTIDGGDVYYACSKGSSYKVRHNEETGNDEVSGRLFLNIPDGYVQFAVDAAIAGDNSVLACNIYDAYNCVTLDSELTFSEVAVEDKKMTGHKDGDKVYFWGKRNDSSPARCEWTLTTADGDLTKSVALSSVAANKAYNLDFFKIEGHEFVDLGLPSGLKWATMNVGATKPEEYGEYFMWGEVKGHKPNGTGEGAFTSDFESFVHTDTRYTGPWDASAGFCILNTPYQTQNTYDSYAIKYTKYLGSTTSEYKDLSATDEDAVKTVLDPEDDAAHINWGGTWRMPTREEIDELFGNTDSAWTDDYKGTGVSGYIFTGINEGYTNKSIFLPAAGIGYETNLNHVGIDGCYWSSSLFLPGSPHSVEMIFYDIQGESGCESDNRWNGNSVRPVSE